MSTTSNTRRTAEFDVVSDTGQVYRVVEYTTFLEVRELSGKRSGPIAGPIEYRCGTYAVNFDEEARTFDILTDRGPVRCRLVT